MRMLSCSRMMIMLAAMMTVMVVQTSSPSGSNDSNPYGSLILSNVVPADIVLEWYEIKLGEKVL